jgi:hypothetical protein
VSSDGAPGTGNFGTPANNSSHDVGGPGPGSSDNVGSNSATGATGAETGAPAKTAAEILASLPDIKKHIKNLQLEFITLKQQYEAEGAGPSKTQQIKGEKDGKNYYQCAVGEVLGSGYKCKSKLGTGVYSSVWQCEKYDPEEKREVGVAVKLVLDEF